MSAAPAFRSLQFLVLALTFFACCAAHSGPIFHMVSYAIFFGMPAMAAVSIYRVEGLAGLGGRLLLGLLADRFGAKQVLIAGWLFTARSCVGLPIAPNLLVYATTGFALTDLSVSNSVTTIGAASARGLVMGKVFGAGAEWALTRNWTLRGEYLYLDFGNVSVNAPTVQPAGDYNTARTTADLTAQVVRMGLNYKF
jgi:MFS family permease